MGLFSSPRCDQCRLPLRKAVYLWRFPGRGKMRVCPTCNTKFEHEQSKIAFAQNNPFQPPAPAFKAPPLPKAPPVPWAPPLPGAPRGFFAQVKTAALIVACGVAVLLALGVVGIIVGAASPTPSPAGKPATAAASPARSPAPTPAPPVAPPPAPAAVVAASPAPAASPTPAPVAFRTADEAKREAVRRFPNLAVPNSTFNANFVAGYHHLQREQPAELQNPNWPLTLAQKVAAGAVFLEPETAAPAEAAVAEAAEAPAAAPAAAPSGEGYYTPGGTWVKSYQRKDGTVVHGHSRR